MTNDRKTDGGKGDRIPGANPSAYEAGYAGIQWGDGVDGTHASPMSRAEELVDKIIELSSDIRCWEDSYSKASDREVIASLKAELAEARAELLALIK